MFRSDFPIFATHPDLVFLDSASSAQKPKMVIDSISRFFASDYANIHRGAYDLSMESSRLYELAKTKLSHLLGLSSYHELVFTYNATYAFNILARTLVKSGKLNRWDHILLSKADHHANIVPWQIIAAEYGIIIDWIDLHDDGTIDYTSLKKQITTSKLLSITGGSNVTGEVLDLERVKKILDALEEKPIWVLDGSQRFPHMETNILTFWIDIFVGTGHKVMSDTGIWFFAAKKELLQSLDPAICWGGAINSVTTLGYDPAGLPFRHEPGTPHIAGAVSLLASLDYIESIGGFAKIEQYEKELVEYALIKIRELPNGVKLIGSSSSENRLWVFSFSFDDHHPNDIAEILADQWICVRSGHHCADPLHASLGLRGSLRMSLYIYNTTADIDVFFEALSRAIVN